MSTQIEWRNGGSPGNPNQLKEIEATLDVSFPEDFCRLILSHQGGVPHKNSFIVPAVSGAFGSCVGAFLWIEKENDDSIEIAIRNLEFLPSGFVPFADDGGGNYICFNYNKLNVDHSSTVVYWNRSASPKDQVIQLCSTFCEFLSMLSERGEIVSKLGAS